MTSEQRISKSIDMRCSLVNTNKTIYANTNKTYLSDLITANNRILRAMQYKSIFTRLTELYKNYDTLSILLLHNYKLCIFLHKYLYHPLLLPISLHNHFKVNYEIHTHNTRIRTNIHLSRFNTLFGKRKLHYHAAIIWNKLPIHLKLITNIFKFKRQLMEYLSNYSVTIDSMD